MNKFIYTFKLELKDSVMKRKDQELLERADGNESWEEEPADQEADGLEDEFDREFWIKVRQKQSEGMSWNGAMDEVRVERLIQKYKDNGELASEDPALVMLKKWPAFKQYQYNSDHLPGLEQLINRFLEILLKSELNAKNRYEKFRDNEDKTKKTLMHYAAELDFPHVTKTLVKKCPGLLARKTEAQLKPEKKRGLLPVELALTMENDDVAAYLIRMMSHERVQSLFSWRPDGMPSPQPSFFSFKSIIENSKMKKSVVAILDQMVNPHWPHLPKRKDNYDNQEEKEGIEGAWSTIPDNPFNYYFYYHILDGDEAGRPPKVMASEGKKLTDNEYFNQGDKSCLHLIAKSNNKEALQHPVVRMLIKTKWQSYGHWFLSLQAGFHVIFLLLFSYSLMYGSTRLNPTLYKGAADSLRGFCELLTLLMVVVYACEEINQIRK